MSPKSKIKDPAVDLSTLLALARVRNKSVVDRQRVLLRLSSPWAKNLAEAIIDSKDETQLSPDEAKDLHSVRQLAGVAK
jgi:hypothetical protein